MTNTLHPLPTDDAFTARLLTALDRHWAAEDSARARAAQAQPGHSTPGTSTTPGSAYLRLWRDLQEVQAKNAAAAAQSLAAIPTISPTPAPSAVPPANRGVLPFRPSAPSRRWPARPHAFHALSPRLAATLLAMVLGVGTSLYAYDVYAAGIRARQATVTYINAPLADVVTELRHRSGVDIRYCNVAPDRNRVTLTLTDTPLDSVLHQIGRQNKLAVHWWWNPNTVLLQPRIEINEEHGWKYNMKMLLLSFTTIGCRP